MNHTSYWESPIQNTVSKDTVLFHDINGIYYLTGEKLAWMLRLLDEPVYCDVLGADPTLFMVYAQKLLQRDIKVGVARGNVVHMLKKDNPNPHPHILSTTIGISPELLVGRKELIRLARSKEMHSYYNQELINTLKEYLRTDNSKEIKEYGTLYVYRVYDLYELDLELTTMPRSVVDALLVAAYQTGRMIKCQLVEPKGRRKNGSKQQRKITVSEPVTYGQLGMAL